MPNEDGDALWEKKKYGHHCLHHCECVPEGEGAFRLRYADEQSSVRVKIRTFSP